MFLSVQVDDKATDTYADGGFRLELEKSPAARPASGLKGRARFFQLLTSRELGDLLALQAAATQPLPGRPMTMNRGVCESYDVHVSSVISSYGV